RPPNSPPSAAKPRSDGDAHEAELERGSSPGVTRAIVLSRLLRRIAFASGARSPGERRGVPPPGPRGAVEPSAPHFTDEQPQHLGGPRPTDVARGTLWGARRSRWWRRLSS